MPTTRQRILEEATRQLPEHGYAAFKMAAVREALGISSGSLFHAFPSKPALAAAVFVEGMADYQGYAIDAIAGAPDPEQALRAWVFAHLSWIEDHRELARYLFSSLPPEVSAEACGPLDAYNARFNDVLAALFEQARAAKLVGPLPDKVAHVLCIAPAHEYGRLWSRGQADTPPRDIVKLLQNAAIAALANTVGTRARRKTPSRPSKKNKKETRR
jgi:AcrR family transcriptional regulator